MNAKIPIKNSQAAFEHHATTPLSLEQEAASLKGSLLKNIKRSAYVYRVDCGGCNGCEIEIFAAITPVFDAERFGIKVVSSPRHADILIFTGAVTRAMRMPALRAFHATPDPKVCVSLGACGCGGGIFHDLYCVWGGSDKIVPIDVYIPGCPPTPAAIIHGFATALGILEQKLQPQQHDMTGDEKVALIHPNAPLDVRVLIEREARLMAGYYQGRLISERLVGLLEKHNKVEFVAEVDAWLKQEYDPRLNEIVAKLMTICKANLELELKS